MEKMQVWSLGQEDPLEKEMAIHSGILAWRIPWIEEPGGLQSMGSQRVGHDRATEQQQAAFPPPQRKKWCLANTLTLILTLMSSHYASFSFLVASWSSSVPFRVEENADAECECISRNSRVCGRLSPYQGLAFIDHCYLLNFVNTGFWIRSLISYFSSCVFLNNLKLEIL